MTTPSLDPELVLEKGSAMTIRQQINTGQLRDFFIGARVNVAGKTCIIEQMESLQSILSVTGAYWIELRLLIV